MNYEVYDSVLIKSKLFTGMTEEEIHLALKCMKAWTKKFKKGEIVVRFGEPAKYAILVLKGEVWGSLYEPLDKPMEVMHGKPGEILMCPISVKANAISQGELAAHVDSEVMFLETRELLNLQEEGGSWHSKVTTNAIQLLADHAIMLNQRLRVIAHKGIQDRILIYLKSLPPKEDGTKVVPMTMTEFARFIHVDKSALYKNIREMQEEGVLKWGGTSVKLLIDLE